MCCSPSCFLHSPCSSHLTFSWERGTSIGRSVDEQEEYAEKLTRYA